MKNYKNSDYALNKYSEGIVYQFTDSMVEVTLADYLRENPEKTEADFMELKALSDAIYHEQDLEDNRYGKRVRTLESAEGQGQYAAVSPERELIHQSDLEQAAKAARMLFTGGYLTEVQKQRFILHFYQGLSYRQIAARENVDFTSVRESIKAASVKLQKIFEKI